MRAINGGKRMLVVSAAHSDAAFGGARRNHMLGSGGSARGPAGMKWEEREEVSPYRQQRDPSVSTVTL